MVDDKSVIANVVATVVGVGVSLLPTVVGVIITVLVVDPPSEHNHEGTV